MVYQGSKKKYVKYIVPILQEAIDKNNISMFIDGCVGGCHIIEQVSCQNRLGIDNNKYLIAFLDYIAHGGKVPEETPSKEHFLEVKDNKDKFDDWYVGMIEHLCSFNGGGFHKSYGCVMQASGRNGYIERRNNILKQAPNLKGIEFKYQDINDLDVSGAVVYIDPPYNKTSKYDSLIGNPFDYERFWDAVRRLSAENYVFVSEEAAPQDFRAVWTLETKRTIKGSVKIATENLFVYKGGLSDGTL
ncbi:MAG: DNA adenine methylase [Lachnospiraceae bacterium]|nr:DNA adenine methylase [Lachnospiraceae bacterium]